MKFIHLSDLHLGKRVNEFSMLEDQQYILAEILQIMDREQPHGVLIAGDVYDKAVPSAEAVALLDDFLVSLSQRKLQVFLISGNHDSPERMAFGGRLMEGSGIHIAPAYHGEVTAYTVEDEYGPIHIYLLPFVKPAHVRRYFPEADIQNYTDAIHTAVAAMGVDPSQRNILVTHQFVTGATRCDSEERSVGGSDEVDASVLDGFDYVALGHLHGPQQVGKETVRYCGTPLKYSFSEASHKKSVTVAEIGEKAEGEGAQLSVRTVPLEPLRDLREIRGTYMELTDRSFYQKGKGSQEDYLHVTLTDEEDVPDAAARLRIIYPNLMRLDYDNRRTRAGVAPVEEADTGKKPPLELFAEFYERQNNGPMSEEQLAFAEGLIEKIWEDEG